MQVGRAQYAQHISTSAHVIPYGMASITFLLSLSSVELIQHVHRTQPNTNLKQLLGNNGMRGSGNAFGAGTARKPAFMGHARGKLNAAALVMHTHAVNAASAAPNIVYKCFGRYMSYLYDLHASTDDPHPKNTMTAIMSTAWHFVTLI